MSRAISVPRGLMRHCNGLNPVRHARFFASEAKSDLVQRGFGGGKFLALVLGVGVAGGSATLAFAYYDPKFREQLENNAPILKPYLQQLFGESKPERRLPLPGIEDLRKRAAGILPEKKPRETTVDSSELPPIIPRGSTNVEKSAAATATFSASEKSDAKVKADAADRQKDAKLQQQISAEDAQKRKANQDLEKQLQEATSLATQQVSKALEAKAAAVVAIANHTKSLRQAVEDPGTQKSDPQWQQVGQALETMQVSLKRESQLTQAAQLELDKLKRIVNSGRSSKLTADNSLLLKAAETSNILASEIDDAQSKIQSAQTESKIITEYKTLIEKGREQFANELKSILPHADISTAKGKKLTEDEANALIAHAHLRVDQLRRQLADQQLREQAHIHDALQRQNAEHTRIVQERTEQAVKKSHDQFSLELNARIFEEKQKSEEQLTNQLRRSAAAHSEHLEEVLRIQSEQFRIELQQKLNDAIQKEREAFQLRIAKDLAVLEGIEKALEGRLDMDAENRRSKELWLAAQHFRDAVLFGRRIGRDVELRKKPLANEVMAIKEASQDDAFVNTLLGTLKNDSLHSGVYTEEDLINRFYTVKKLCKRTAMIGDNGGTLVEYFLSFLQSLFVIDRSRVYSASDAIDVSKADTFGILSRAAYFIEKGEMEHCVRLMQLLQGEPRRLSQSWIDDATTHLETKLIAQLLLSHASASSVRTVY